MISVKCPNTQCHASYQVPDEFLGRSVVCKKCKAKFKVADLNGAAPRPNAAPTTLANQERPAAPPAPVPQAGGSRKTLFVFLGLGAAGAVSCLAVLCVVGIIVAWYKWGGRAPETYGGIEISSTTVKASVVEFFPDSDAGFDYKFLSEDEMQVTTNIEKIGPEGDFDPDSFEKTVTAIATFYKDLQSKHQVAPDKIMVIVASGVFKGIETNKEFNEDQKKALIAKNQDKLRARILADTKRQVEFVDLEMELQLQIKSLIPEKEMDRTLVVDLGNSLCRGGGYDTKLKRYTIFNPKIGVKGLLKRAEEDAATRGYKKSKRPEDRKMLAEAAAKQVDDYFRVPLLKEMEKTTEINGRKRIELVGGTPWVTATFKNPAGRAKKHTKLTKKDIDAFYEEVRKESAYPAFDMPKGVDDKLSKTLRSDVDSMEQRINVESLIAGTEMLKVLSEELTFQHREVYFNNNGQKALVLGFMTKLWEKGKK